MWHTGPLSLTPNRGLNVQKEERRKVQTQGGKELTAIGLVVLNYGWPLMRFAHCRGERVREACFFLCKKGTFEIQILNEPSGGSVLDEEDSYFTSLLLTAGDCLHACT